MSEYLLMIGVLILFAFYVRHIIIYAEDFKNYYHRIRVWESNIKEN